MWFAWSNSRSNPFPIHISAIHTPPPETTWLAGTSPFLTLDTSSFMKLFFHCHVSFPGSSLAIVMFFLLAVLGEKSMFSFFRYTYIRLHSFIDSQTSQKINKKSTKINPNEVKSTEINPNSTFLYRIFLGP